MQHYPMGNYVDLGSIRLTSPTCEDLGIPTEQEDPLGFYCPPRVIRNPGLHLDGLRYEAAAKKNPFSPFCMIPLPSQFALEGALEPAFIRKRNERERERVKCVNEGFDRLKERLPLDNKDKRISKVEILRAAAQYIRDLHDLLSQSEPGSAEEEEREREDEENELESPPCLKREDAGVDSCGCGDNGDDADDDDSGDGDAGRRRLALCKDGDRARRGKKRRCLSSDNSEGETSPKRLNAVEDGEHAGREGPFDREFSDPDSSWNMSSDVDL